MWFDSHCHLPESEAADVVADAVANGVHAMVTVGTTVERSRECIATAQQFDNVWASAGVHPHDASGGIDGLAELLDDPNVVAVGEAGLDYHYMHSTVEEQRRVFASQIGLANATGLPLIIHTRDAWADTFEVLDAEGVPERTILHCFTGGPDEAAECIRRGLFLSFSGIVTFPKAPELREAAAMCPEDRLLVETDAPYLAPVPHRGRPNRPALVGCVGATVAETRGETLERVAASTSQNAQRVFGVEIGDAGVPT